MIRPVSNPTARHQPDEAISPGRLWSAFDWLPEAMLFLDRLELRLLAANQAAEELLGLAQLSVRDSASQISWLLPALRSWCSEQSAMEHERAERLGSRCSVVGLGGEPLHVEVYHPPDDSELLLVTLRRHAPACSRCAEYARDPVTSLPSRAIWESWILEAEHRQNEAGESFAIVLMDIDNFKQINDSWGHACGDRVLQIVGRRLQQLTGERRRIARFGGDEFAMLISPLTAADDLTASIEALRGRLAEPISLHAQKVLLTASLGAASVNEHTPTATEVLFEADRALYAAKRARVSRHGRPYPSLPATH